MGAIRIGRNSAVTVKKLTVESWLGLAKTLKVDLPHTVLQPMKKVPKGRFNRSESLADTAEGITAKPKANRVRGNFFIFANIVSSMLIDYKSNSIRKQ